MNSCCKPFSSSCEFNYYKTCFGMHLTRVSRSPSPLIHLLWARRSVKRKAWWLWLNQSVLLSSESLTVLHDNGTVNFNHYSIVRLKVRAEKLKSCLWRVNRVNQISCRFLLLLAPIARYLENPNEWINTQQWQLKKIIK